MQDASPDDRIAQLEAELLRRDREIAAKDARIALLEEQIANLTKQVARDGPSAKFGHQLLDYTGLIFEYWHDYNAGKLSREMFVAWMAPVRRQFETVLAQAVSAEIAGVSGSCADILEHQAAL